MDLDSRSERFNYICNRCLHCCYDKTIQLNPYEVARLARNRAISTSELRERYTIDGAGVALSRREDGACVFLGGDGCTVHPDRPLVCRLYPLGRHVTSDGDESFSHVEGHPLSKGVLSRRGTIAGYLENQGAGPFLDAADEYFFWLCRAQAHIEVYPEQAELAGESALSADILDMDIAIRAYCDETGDPEPDDIEERKRLHMSILDDLIMKLSAFAQTEEPIE
jgi:Fe-S-cluster containining protein